MVSSVARRRVRWFSVHPDAVGGDIEICLGRRSSILGQMRDASSAGGRAPHISSGSDDPMMPIPLRRRISEGGCPIKMAVRGPCPRPSSPPHGPATENGEVVAVVFPHVIHDLAQAPGQSHPGDLISLPLFHRAEPRPQRAGLARGLGRRQHEDPAHQAVAFLTDVPTAHPVGARAHARREPDVAGHVLGAREARDRPAP